MNFDKFELIVIIQRFFGLFCLRFLTGNCMDFMRQRRIFFKYSYLSIKLQLMLNFYSPCLMNDFNCLNIKNDMFGTQKFQQLIIRLINKAFILIISRFTLKENGLWIEEIIHWNQWKKIEWKLFRCLYWQILFFYLYVFFAISAYILSL